MYRVITTNPEAGQDYHRSSSSYHLCTQISWLTSTSTYYSLTLADKGVLLIMKIQDILFLDHLSIKRFLTGLSYLQGDGGVNVYKRLVYKLGFQSRNHEEPVPHWRVLERDHRRHPRAKRFLKPHKRNTEGPRMEMWLSWVPFIVLYKLSVVEHVYNVSTWEIKTEGSEVQSNSQIGS